MSIFHFPRIHVFGRQLVNAGTANNDSIGPGDEITITSDSARVQPVLNGMQPEEFRQWLIGLDQQDLLRCQWNYFGDMSLKFLDVEVLSVQHEPGEIITDHDTDALIGAKIDLANAVVCDNNPEGFNTTQIFADSLTIRSGGERPAFGGTGTFVSRQPTRATTRGLNWSRNVSFHGTLGDKTSGGAAGASAGFQCSMAILVDDLLDAANPAIDQFEHHFVATDSSPTLQKLVELLRDRTGPHPIRGLTFRYNLHRAYPAHSDPDLAKDFAAGINTENPAVGLVSGTIAPWYVGEPESGTMGRVLNPTKPYPNPYASRPYYLSQAVARVDPPTKTIAVDLSNTLPADGEDGYPFDLGAIAIGVRQPTAAQADPNDNDAPIHPLGEVDPDRDGARACSFLYDLDYSSLSIAQQGELERGDSELVLTTDVAGLLMFEPEHHVLLDSECNYLDDPGPGRTLAEVIPTLRSPQTPTPLQGRSPIVVHRRGHSVTGPLWLTVEQWRLTPSGDPANYGFYQYPVLMDSQPTVITVNDGWGNVDLVPAPGSPGGARLFRFVPESFWPQSRPPELFAWLICDAYYASLRILPFDDYQAIIDRGPTFADVYEHVLMYYDLLMPAMNERLPMGDESLWDTPTAARYLKRVIDPGLWSSTTYMPRTRDLSATRRELMLAFCDAVINAHEEASNPDERDDEREIG